MDLPHPAITAVRLKEARTVQKLVAHWWGHHNAPMKMQQQWNTRLAVRKSKGRGEWEFHSPFQLLDLKGMEYKECIDG